MRAVRALSVVTAAVIGIAIGAGYVFLALVTMGLAMFALVILMSPFLVMLMRSRVPVGRRALAVALIAGFVVGGLGEFTWFAVPLRLGCAKQSCGLVTTLPQDVLWILLFVGTPVALIAIALAVRRRFPRTTPAQAVVTVVLANVVVVIGVWGLLLVGMRSSGTFSSIDVRSPPTATPGLVGFYPPLKCRFVPPATVEARSTTWRFDCGAENSNARAALSPSLVDQGWKSCGDAGGSAFWSKEGMRVVVTEATPGAGGLPTIQEVLQEVAGCP